MLNPIEYILLHVENAGLPLLETGDTILYDVRYKRTVPNVALFESLLGKLYLYEQIGGNRLTGSMVVYQITGWKHQTYDNSLSPARSKCLTPTLSEGEDTF